MKILCAAIYINDGLKHIHQPKNISFGYVICGRRHHNCITSFSIMTQESIMDKEYEQGFLTEDDRFVSRKEAAEIAFKSGQIKEELESLTSEDLY